ncbi:MAG TPA: YfcE family phosphodiesterase [Blastocatellia bacterium]|nr:YfcE family phosphodiesterase [Blastocatellia bacterium]
MKGKAVRYLILSDIHGNIDALEAITERYDRLLVLGDVVDYGAAPEEAGRWMRDRNPIAVSGNHDFAMATGADCRSSPISYALSVATREHFRPLLSEATLYYLGGLPEQRTVNANGTSFHLVHATPRDPLYEYLSGDAEDSVWRAAVGDLAERDEWLLLGHTHRPFVRKIERLTVVNPGSLGMPIDGDPRACYAVWEDGEIYLKRAPYDVERAVERLRMSGLSEDVVTMMSEVLRHAGRGG